MKRLIMISLMFACILLSPFSASANDGQWNLVAGYSGFLSSKAWISDRTEQFKSTGGNFKIEASSVASDNCFKVQLMEADSSNGDDEIGGVRTFCGNDYSVWDVSSAVDGGNGAELYLLYGQSSYYDDYVFFKGFD